MEIEGEALFGLRFIVHRRRLFERSIELKCSRQIFRQRYEVPAISFDVPAIFSRSRIFSRHIFRSSRQLFHPAKIMLPLLLPFFLGFLTWRCRRDAARSANKTTEQQQQQQAKKPTLSPHNDNIDHDVRHRRLRYLPRLGASIVSQIVGPE